jgi:xanthine/uracil/vitamin C permease (AzgA family)
VVTGALFLLAIFIASLARIVPTHATAPVLIMVGYFMMTIVRDISWDDAKIGIPALLIIVVQPFTFNIANGIGAGFIAYTVIQILAGDGLKDLAFAAKSITSGRMRDLATRDWSLHPLMFLVSAVFGWYFWRGLIA